MSEVRIDGAAPGGGLPAGSAGEQLAALAAAYREDPERVPAYTGLRRRVLAEPATRTAAVLVLFGVLDSLPARHASATVPSDLDLLLVLRASGLRDHAGEIAFPGGGVEDGDADEIATALREAEEETGLDPEGVRVLGVLPQAPTISRFTVTPVLGWWDRPTAVDVVDEGESAAVFRTPVADLVDPANRVRTEFRRNGATLSMPAFQLPQGLLWGFTAVIVSSLLDELGWAEPWDQTRVVPPPGY